MLVLHYRAMTNTTPAQKYATREDWLTAATEQLSTLFNLAGHVLPPVRLSVGWPYNTRPGSKVIGECWKPEASADGVAQVFISPRLDDPVRILDVLAHELVHATNYATGHSGHGKEFRAVAVALGLTGRMTATVAGPELAATLTDLAAFLGPLPHAALNPGDGVIVIGGGPGGGVPVAPPRPKQTARMLKVVCQECGYLCRVSSKWLDSAGAPLCPTHNRPLERA